MRRTKLWHGGMLMFDEELRQAMREIRAARGLGEPQIGEGDLEREMLLDQDELEFRRRSTRREA
jgi:hypothetical protein